MSLRRRAWLACVLVGLAIPPAFAGGSGRECGLPSGVRLVLPKILYAAAGLECNIYFDNVVLALHPAHLAFDVDCAKGVQQAERWTFTPRAKDVGQYDLALTVRDAKNRTIAQGRSTLRVVDPKPLAGRTVSVLMIGDSLTHASIYPRHVWKLSRGRPGPKVDLVGSHCPKDPDGVIRHEGYGGWTAERFATHYTTADRTSSYRKRPSPFLYKQGQASPRFDFTRYCDEVCNGKAPDVVTIFLGCNDTFSATDETIEGRIDVMVRHTDALVAAIHSASRATRIGLILPVPPAVSQDAFGANYRCGQTRWQYRRNQHRVVERMLAKYGGREADCMTIVPAYVNLDCVRCYPTTQATWNAQTKVATQRQCNGVHPAESGYRQIGDSVYAWLVAQLGEQGSGGVKR